MKKLFEEVQERLARFVEQRDDIFMIIGCHDFETAYVLKILQAIDESNNSDLFWMFVDEFKDPFSYIETIIEQFKAKHDGVSEGLKKEGKMPWPTIPPLVFDNKLDPMDRLKGLMTFSRSLLPSEEGHLTIWGFFPYQIKQPELYREMANALISHQFPYPWCHHMRIFLRDEKNSPILFKRGNLPRVCFYDVDFSVKALENSLREEVMDSSIPLGQRLQSLLSVAGLDLSNRRYTEALQKFQILLRYYQGRGDFPMTALLLNWIGEAHEKSGNLREAQKYYESALTPAIESKSEPILLNIILNLANLKIRQEVWNEAEIYYESAEKIATALRIPQAKIMCLENRGICQYMQKNVGGALESWENGATLARAMEEKLLLKNILIRLRDYHKETGQSKEQNKIEQELNILNSC